MVYGLPALDGSPCRTASWAPAGRDGGAGPHLTWSRVNATCLPSACGFSDEDFPSSARAKHNNPVTSSTASKSRLRRAIIVFLLDTRKSAEAITQAVQNKSVES